MATTEEQLINSICSTGDVSVLMDSNIDALCGEYYGDVLRSAKQYYSKYKAVPHISILTEEYPDLIEIDTPAAPNFYLERLTEQYLDNRLESIMMKASELKKTHAKAQVLDKMQVELSKLNRFTKSVKDLDITDTELAEIHFERTRERAEAMGGSPGISTGVQFIDASYITGMAPGHLIVCIGWPGKGKTWMASYIAANAFAKGFSPMIFSLEMTGEDMRGRIYTQMGSGLFSASGFARGDVDIDNFRSWSAKYMTGNNKFHVVSPDGISDVTPNTIQGKIEQYKPDMLVLDYAQLLSDNRGSDAMTPRMMNLSREIKQLAVVNDIPVILITAATAEDSSDRNDPPTLDKVAWSKAIEYDADMAFAVQRHDDSNLIEIVGRKNRHGSLFAGYIEADIDRGIWTERFDL